MQEIRLIAFIETCKASRFLSHKRVKNRNYSDQYLVENNHEPIVSREAWDAVQKEKEKRALAKNNVIGDRGKYTSK